jgi:murein L,D-transpeptidase YafK
MQKRLLNRRKGRALALMTLAFIIPGILLTMLLRSKPPIIMINEAGQQLSQARKLQSQITGVHLQPYLLAEAAFDSTMALWAQENERFYLVRDYSKVQGKAAEAKELAEKAILDSYSQMEIKGNELRARSRVLKAEMKEFQLNYGHLPYNHLYMNEFAETRLLFAEGVIACDKGDYDSASRKMKQVEETMSKLFARYEQMVRDYFERYPVWQRWNESTMEYSRRIHAVVVIVDKYSRECHVYSNGELQNSYKVELGPNWMGDKNHQGDRSTPEGLYSITSKKSGVATSYHKALLLDYPNPEDKKRFLSGLKAGTIPRDEKIGHSIEIHGMGGKGADWTDGCIALRNEDMDQLFSQCSKGTRVTIVGSLVNLEEIGLKPQ